MSNIINAKILEVQEDELLLELPSGQTMSWPNDSQELDYSEGDNIKLSINSEKDLINQILKG
ncbi:hypothetical protein KKC88_01615 [Patescibacteria group bacterium]|nr:hypothetical protein [Patescibacteria group bacterium]MBU1673207.1 hypothetical protein [Patescibacteria group bacterium]MBU1963013.1 hypothetical protein [Patescibacteria group bacterium]